MRAFTFLALELLLILCACDLLDGAKVRVEKKRTTTAAQVIVPTTPTVLTETTEDPDDDDDDDVTQMTTKAGDDDDDDQKDDKKEEDKDDDDDDDEQTTTDATQEGETSTKASLDDDDDDDDDDDAALGNGTKQITPDCTQPAFLSFPTDLFRVVQNPGFVWIHILVTLYLFLAIALICDDYFCPSLDVTAQKMGLSEDVAGATLMSFGSSAPELFISIIAVFVGSTDVGTGTIVGSAVFNILFVIGICGILVSRSCVLSWWAFIRDSVCYIITVVVLLLLMIDNNVSWWESGIMLLLYGLYILLMKYNDAAHSLFVAKFSHWIKKDEPEMSAEGGVAKLDGYCKTTNNGYNQVPLVYNDGQLGTYTVVQPSTNGTFVNAVDAPTGVESAVLMVDEEIAYGRYALKLSFEDACWRFMITWQFRPITRFRAAGYIMIFERRKLMQYSEFSTTYKHIGLKLARGASSYSMKKSIIDPADTQAWRVAPPKGLNRPFLSWLLCYPIRFVMFYTIVDCRMQRFERYYVATFLLSVLWISVISYILVWVVTLIGYVFGIPDAVMGITLLAAGTSISDCVSSVIVARKGYGDMAVSNSFGSNVFDILVGLGFPWFIQTALVSPGSTVSINSRGLLYDSVLLFAAIFGTLLMIYMCDWRLNKKLGYASMGLYLVFLVFSLMIEFNLLGYVNLPMCEI